MNFLERIIFAPRGGKFREFEGLMTHFEPKDVTLYRNLLPEAFSMPNRPLVTIYVADNLRLIPWPMTHYQEWAVLLKSDWNGEEGWYPVTMPVTRWLAMSAGRYLGFPKYIADEITLVRNNETRVAYARYKNRTQLTLEFHPGLTRQLTPWEKELAGDESFFKENIFHTLVPPGRGPRAQKIIIRHIISPKWSPQDGMLQVQVDPGESWKGLVPDISEFPGTYNHFIGGFNLIAERANFGNERSNSDPSEMRPS
jgi:hypothetical protein